MTLFFRFGALVRYVCEFRTRSITFNIAHLQLLAAEIEGRTKIVGGKINYASILFDGIHTIETVISTLEQKANGKSSPARRHTLGSLQSAQTDFQQRECCNIWTNTRITCTMIRKI